MAGEIALTLRINVDWSAAAPNEGDNLNDQQDPSAESFADLAEISTVAHLSLDIDGQFLTRMLDSERELHDGPRVSAYRFAEWLIWNWWRIRWEPAHGQVKDLSWRLAHHTASIGGGWLWPLLEFESDGETIAIRSDKSDRSQTEPVSYLGGDEQFVSAEDFERGVDEFLAATIDRLSKKFGLLERSHDSSLGQMWSELQEERSNRKLAAYRRIEALLGYNPDEGPEEIIQQLIADSV